MNKRVVFWIKLVLTVAVVAFIGWEVAKNFQTLRKETFTIDWRYVAGSLAAFGLFMVQSALVWVWLARRMGDRSPVVKAVGAYVFSQMGKYVPGKVALLLMRIERAGRAGMNGQTVVVATLVENAMYMVSGAIIAAGTLLIYARENLVLVGLLLAGMFAMCAVFHPKIFFYLVNRVLRKMGRPEVPPEQQFRIPHMMAAVAGFVPCWFLGGLSLWLATRAISMNVSGALHSPTAGDYLKFPGTVAFGVVGGMAFLTPGGVGPREFIMGLFLYPIVGNSWATLAVVLQRLVQVATEVGLGVAGGAVAGTKGKGEVKRAESVSAE